MRDEFEDSDYIVWINYGSDGWMPLTTHHERPITDINSAIQVAIDGAYGNGFVITRKAKYTVIIEPDE